MFLFHTGISKFLLNALKLQNSPIAKEFYHAMRVRINERRNKHIVSLIKYLHNKDLNSSEEMPLSSRKACANLACDLFINFFELDEVAASGSSGGTDDVVENSLDSSTADDDTQLDLTKMLSTAIDNETGAAKPSTSTSLHSDMKKLLQHEISGYEKNNVLGGNLQKILSALKSIQPTSTESERTFSLAENTCTKKKGRLSDKSLNNIVFLKSYFKRKDTKKY